MPDLASLPPELLDHIITHLPTASSISRLSRTSKDLHAFVEKEAWHTFNRTRFPSLHPTDPSYSAFSKDLTRTLTSLSRAWDRRALVVKYIEPSGHIVDLPTRRVIKRWKKPSGQTIGFLPRLDCWEEVESSWNNKREVLAFSAGAGICVRDKRQSDKTGRQWWLTHQPPGAREGRDDVTALHLLPPDQQDKSDDGVPMITGTASGSLQLLSLPSFESVNGKVHNISFATDGLSVRSSDLLKSSGNAPLLAVNLHDTGISLYPVATANARDDPPTTVLPIDQINLPRPSSTQATYRIWSTTFLSPTTLAMGLGPSTEPIHIHTITPTGLSSSPLRTFGLENSLSTNQAPSSIHPIIPLPSSNSTLFLSGAHDGTTRLHDLRTIENVVQAYHDPTNDTAVFSLLARGQEKFLAGSSRHSMLRIFDLRMRAKFYDYRDAYTHAAAPRHQMSEATSLTPGQEIDNNYNLFLQARRPSWGNYRRHGIPCPNPESPIYTLASPGPYSTEVYAGMENTVMQLDWSEVGNEDHRWDKSGETVPVAMYEHGGRLLTQRGVAATSKGLAAGEEAIEGLDRQWKLGGSV